MVFERLMTSFMKFKVLILDSFIRSILCLVTLLYHIRVKLALYYIERVKSSEDCLCSLYLCACGQFAVVENSELACKCGGIF